MEQYTKYFRHFLIFRRWGLEDKLALAVFVARNVVSTFQRLTYVFYALQVKQKYVKLILFQK